MYLLSRGKKADEVIEMEAARKRLIEQNYARGFSSEKNVFDILSGLEMVSRVRRTPRGSGWDIGRIDLIVHLDKRSGVIGKVSVQVKSTEVGVDEFKKKVAQENRVPLKEVDGWLLSHRWVVLNGQLPKDVIANSFTSQVTKMAEVARTK